MKTKFLDEYGIVAKVFESIIPAWSKLTVFKTSESSDSWIWLETIYSCLVGYFAKMAEEDEKILDRLKIITSEVCTFACIH
jgi:hypothetical protein